MSFNPKICIMKIKGIKKIGFLLTALLILLGFSGKATEQLEISGQAPGKDGQLVELIRYTEGSLDKLAKATVENGRFRLDVPVDEISLAVLQINKAFGGTVIIEPAKLSYVINQDGTFDLKGGKYNPVLSGYLHLKAFIAADELFRKLTKGGNVEAIKGTKEEWEMIQPFLAKEELRSNYLAGLVENHPDPKVKVMAAIMCELQPDAAKTMQIIEKVAPKAGENTIMMRRVRSLAKQQAEALARRHAGMLGEQAADFTAANLKGESVSLWPVIKANKYTLVQFWASWCGPCRKEIPLLKQLYTRYRPKGLQIISFSMDDNRNNWEKASEAENFNWLNVSDLQAFKSPVARNYPIFGIPANVIVDQTGKILASNLLGKELEDKISNLLK